MSLQRQSISAETAPASGAARVPAGTARNGLLLAGSLVLAAVMVLAEPATAAEHAPEKAGAEPEAVKPLDLEGVREALGRGEAKKAVLHLRFLASQGNPDAQLLLGDLFMEGRGIYQNYSMAGNWYKKSAQAGNADSQFKLAGLYLKGLGVPLYIGRGRELLINAAQQGHAEAIESLKKQGIEPPPMMVKEGEGAKDGKDK
ncbi:MAG: sel1 repeat family protein [Proteobacteria bacterium]|nr:sel1 repeat family protein [Pseudomonadota bacterium]